MRKEIVEKLVRIGYTEEESKECYLFYQKRNKLPILNEFADDMLEMKELDRRMLNEQCL